VTLILYSVTLSTCSIMTIIIVFPYQIVMVPQSVCMHLCVLGKKIEV